MTYNWADLVFWEGSSVYQYLCQYSYNVIIDIGFPYHYDCIYLCYVKMLTSPMCLETLSNINYFATGNTLPCDQTFEHTKHYACSTVQRKTFLRDFLVYGAWTIDSLEFVVTVYFIMAVNFQAFVSNKLTFLDNNFVLLQQRLLNYQI